MTQKKKRTVQYGTVQIRQIIKEQIVDHCDRHGLKIGRYIERLFLLDVSGSNALPVQTTSTKR